MKLLNRSLKYLSFSLLVIISIWSVIFYLDMLDEVYDSIDDGLGNYKLLIIQRAQEDTTVLQKTAFNESNYAIREISVKDAIQVKDTYVDTVMYMLYEQDLEPVRLLTTAFERSGRFYELKVISSMVEEDDLIATLFWSLIWLYLILLLTTILINNVLLRKIWRPFYQILHQLKTYRLGTGQVLPEVETNVTEFKELKATVDALLQHTLETFNNQKQFTENAAHELQTPLAIGINKLELLAEKNDLNEGHTETIGQVIQILERLTRLNKSLLLLSKIENKQFFDNEEVSMNQISKQLIEDFQDFADFKEIEITFTENASLSYEMNPDLANILISNLIKNAVVHNIPKGRIRIHITSTTFTICNTGKTEALDPTRIFSRFHREITERSNTGLGLPIAKAIADLYGFTIAYSYTDEHCMEIRFLK